MRKYLAIFTLAWLLPLLGFAGMNWLIDPYRIFHKPWVRDDYYVCNLRIQAAGVINQIDFDSIIIGTSMAENFSPSEASRVLNGNFVNLSLWGSTILERAVVLEYAFKNKTIANVITTLDWGSLIGIDEKIPLLITPYAYLYDDNRWNDLRLNFTTPSLIEFWRCRNVFAAMNYCKDQRDLETLTQWKVVPFLTRRFGGFEKWLDSKDFEARNTLLSIQHAAEIVESKKVANLDVKPWVEKQTPKYRQKFAAKVLNFVERNSSTQFNFIFPPYSRLFFAISKQTNAWDFEMYLQALRIAVEGCARYPNCRVFGFDNEPFLDDIANYRDLMHYHHRYNSAMLQWMANGEHVLTPDNLDAYIQAITIKAANFSLIQVAAEIKKLLQTQAQSKP